MKFLNLPLLLAVGTAYVGATSLDKILSSIELSKDSFAETKLKARAVSPSPSSLPPPDGKYPIVDLGYAKHQASEYATAGNISYYVFKNIRFAAPPIGELRFRKPQPPRIENNGTVQNGTYSVPTNCVSLDANGTITGSEDCLFLDVYMPVSVAGRKCSPKKLPVLANWYGGGYIFGSKETAGNASTIYAQTGKPFVYVAANYRLGAFGWLAPPKAAVADADWTANAGLHDTLAAMDWIGTHISKFSGDVKRVTAMGMSAGGGVILHAMVSTHARKLPFQQAILQSPGWQPEMNVAGRQPLYDAFVAAANCTTSSNSSSSSSAACLRAASTSQLKAANLRTIAAWDVDALGPTSGFYPVPDGTLLPHSVAAAPPHSWRPLRSIIMTSARWEAGSGSFAPPGVTDAEFITGLSTLTNSPKTQARIASLYPSDGTPRSGFNRGVDFISDVGFNCNSYWANEVYKNKGGRKYMFNQGTAAHGSDRAYTWDPATTRAAEEHQLWIAEYVTTGKVGRDDWPLWKLGGGTALWSNETEGVAVGEDYYRYGFRRERCEVLRDEVYGQA